MDILTSAADFVWLDHNLVADPVQTDTARSPRVATLRTATYDIASVIDARSAPDAVYEAIR